jgi:hypothetical protein
MHKLTQEDVGRRVVGRAHSCGGEIVHVHTESVADVRWDHGARQDWQQIGKDFELVQQVQER